MKRATHFIEVYKNSKGFTKQSFIPAGRTFYLLGLKVIGWKTIAVFKIKEKKHETNSNSTQSN